MASLDNVLEYIFSTSLLLPSESHNIALVNKRCYLTVEMCRKKENKSRPKKYKRIQDIVNKDGLYLSTLNDFLFVKSLGYTINSLTLTFVIKHNGNFEIINYLVKKFKIEIPESAFLNAYQLKKYDIFEYLWNFCYDYNTKNNALEWIHELNTEPLLKKKSQIDKVL